MEVREATADETGAAATVLDAAMLAVEDLPAAVADGDVLVAVEEGRVLGALVRRSGPEMPAWAREAGADAHVAAVAMRRRRRGQGVGTALVRAAAEQADDGDGVSGRLTAAFDADVRPFYESVGFDVEPDGPVAEPGVDDGRRDDSRGDVGRRDDEQRLRGVYDPRGPDRHRQD